MKNDEFAIDDSEDNHDPVIKSSKINNTFIKHQKKKKASKIEVNFFVNNTKSIPLEEQENIEFILMDFRQPEEINKFKNIKSLSLVQQNITTLKVIKFII